MSGRRLRLALGLLLASCSGGGSGGGNPFRFTSAPPTAGTIRVPYSYVPTVAGDIGLVTYSLETAPSGMNVTIGGVVEWTPTYDDLGTHHVVLRANQPGSHVDQTFDLRIDQGLSLGVTLSPRGHTGSSTNQDFFDHFDGHAPHGRVIAFHSAWRDSVGSAGLIPQVALTAVVAASQFTFVPAVGFGWTDGDGNPDLTSTSEPANNTWSNAETRAEFLAMVEAFANTYHPPYIFLGNETNTWWLTHTPAEWADWLTELDACYAAIKFVSPNTIVSTVFQYEHLKGLGAHAGWSDPPQWNLVDDHAASAHVDAIGFTSYPYLEFDDPASLPSDYYDAIAAHWSGPVVFTEIGWLSAPSGPYPGSPQDQADFVPRFFDLAQDFDIVYATWLFQHDWDQEATIPSIAGIGFRSNDGTVVRPSDAAWRTAVDLRE